MNKIDNIVIETCSQCGEYKRLIVNNEVILEGDYYHDKIDNMINDCVCGLRCLGYDFNICKKEFICLYCELDES